MAINPIKDLILDLFADNTDGDITASDMRKFVEGVWADKERKINKYKTLSEALSDPYLYQLDLFLIVDEPVISRNGIYVALINQPNNENEIVQVANLTKNDVLEVQTYNDMINLQANEGDICTVTEDYQTYIFDGTNWTPILSYETVKEAIKDDFISEGTLWSSKKIVDFVTNTSVDHTHEIMDIDGLEGVLSSLSDRIDNKLEKVMVEDPVILKYYRKMVEVA
jgi:hypothetical protein